MPGFDGEWFSELRALTRAKVAEVEPDYFKPSITQIRNAGHLTQRFVETAVKLQQLLYAQGFTFGGEFRAEERHICEWCGLKMACNCFLDDTPNHVQVLCPKCQVMEQLNQMFAPTEEKSPDIEGQAPPTRLRLVSPNQAEKPSCIASHGYGRGTSDQR